MIFDKAIRRRQSPLPLTGHHEMDSHVISGAPNLSLQTAVGELSFLDELTPWPDRLEILVHWQQVPLDPKDVTVQDVLPDQPMTIKEFYNPKSSDAPTLAAMSQNQAISLIFEGKEVYRKTYLYQESSHLVQQRNPIAAGRWRVTAPKSGEQEENLLPLLAYGCHAPRGGRLSDIEQTYASIGTDGKDTCVNLHTESALRQLGIVSPDGGTINGWIYRFIDKNANPSLISDILNHRIQVPITIGEVTKTYVSVAYRESSERDQLIYLTIKPK